jgi:hypothetical protein
MRRLLSSSAVTTCCAAEFEKLMATVVSQRSLRAEKRGAAAPATSTSASVRQAICSVDLPRAAGGLRDAARAAVAAIVCRVRDRTRATDECKRRDGQKNEFHDPNFRPIA